MSRVSIFLCTICFLGLAVFLTLSISTNISVAEGVQKVYLPFVPIAPPPYEQSIFAYEFDESGNKEIYVATTDFLQVRNLSNSPSSDTSPTWSPTGEWLMFLSDREPAGFYVVRPSGNDLHLITTNTNPNWSPQGSWISYFSQDANTQNLYITRPEITQPILVSTNVTNNYAWSSDEKFLAYVVGNDLFVYHAVNNTSTQISAQWQDTLSWDPSNQKIAYFAGSDSDHVDLFVSSFDGVLQYQVTQLNYYKTQFVWSPNGKYIAVTVPVLPQDNSYDKDIYVANPETQSTWVVANGTERQYNPVWLPGGETMVYLIRRIYSTSNAKVIQVDASGNNSVQTHSGDFSYIFLSPDENYLITSDGETRFIPLNGHEFRRYDVCAVITYPPPSSDCSDRHSAWHPNGLGMSISVYRIFGASGSNGDTFVVHITSYGPVSATILGSFRVNPRPSPNGVFLLMDQCSPFHCKGNIFLRNIYMQQDIPLPNISHITWAPSGTVFP